MTNEYFTMRLNQLYDAWKNEQKQKHKKATLQAFADGITEIVKPYKCSYQNVSKWLKGTYPEDMYRAAICTFFNVTPSFFDPKTQEDQLRYAPEMIEQIEKEELLPYCEKIGLDLGFLDFIQQFTDLDGLYPVWTPIGYNRDYHPIGQRIKGEAMTPELIRIPVEQYKLPSAETKDRRFQQTVENEEGSRKILLHIPDLYKLKKMQDLTIAFLESLYRLEAENMQQQVDEVNRRCWEKDGDSFRLAHSITKEEMAAIDPGYYAILQEARETGKIGSDHVRRSDKVTL